jgi:hypothetical protein
MLYPLSYGGDDGDATNEPAGAQSRPASVLAEPSLLNREGGPRAGLDGFDDEDGWSVPARRVPPRPRGASPMSRV